MRSTAEQAFAALRVAVGAALDARTPAVPLTLANFKPAPDAELPAWWVEEAMAGGTSEQSECGPPSPLNHRDGKDVAQFLIRGPKDVGAFAFRNIAASIEAAVTDAALTLDDLETPVIVTSVMVGGLRDADEFGRQSMPVVLFYEYHAPRVVVAPPSP